MESNFLLPSIHRLFNELEFISGNIFVTSNMLTNISNRLLEERPVSNHGIMVTAGCYTDVTLDKGLINLFPTGYGYNLSTLNIKDRIDRAISFNSCLAIAQAYEATESFIKDILALVYIETAYKSEFKFKEVYSTASEVKDNLYQIKKDRGFIKVVRRISPFFKNNESNRSWDVSMVDWFYLIADIRHDIVHRRQIIGKSLEHVISSERNNKKLFDKNFKIRELGDFKLIYTDGHNARSVISNFKDFAFLIFKALSIEIGLDYTYNPKEVQTERDLWLD